MATQDSRIRIKRSTVPGTTPTIPASSNHLDGSWLSTDLYVGEFMTNVADERVWFRASAGLVELNTNTNSDHYGDSSGTDTYTSTVDPIAFAYTTGMVVRIKFGNANTGAATLNVSDLGAKSIKKNGSVALSAGDIKAGAIYTLVYDGTNFQIDNSGYVNAPAISDEWTATTFSAGHYVATAGTWTVASGDVVVNRYKLIGKTLFWQVNVQTSTISGSPITLNVTLPNSYTNKSTLTFSMFGWYLDNVTGELIKIRTVAAGSTVIINQVDVGAFATGTDNQTISFNIVLEIE